MYLLPPAEADVSYQPTNIYPVLVGFSGNTALLITSVDLYSKSTSFVTVNKSPVL